MNPTHPIDPATATPRDMVRWLLADASPDTLTEWASLWLNALSGIELREYVEAALPHTRPLTDTERAVLRGMLP
jgi:hypothetical protein